ncbi:MAG TPA: hypothetical protein VG899_13735 [Mycobacteriales bacterium]|nr:hypothetical protein [Mycobacteriales bacterium]
MPAAVANPYANQDLFIASDVRDRMDDLVSRSAQDARPFARQVDAWWVALGIGVRLRQRTPLPDKTVKFNDGTILATDPWRITHLELLALAVEGKGVLDSPAQVIRIATEYANAGFAWLIEKLLGEAEPTLTLTNRLSEFA